MKTARRMLDNGINLHHKCVGSRYFGSRTLLNDKPQHALIASAQMLATLSLIRTRGSIRPIHPALKILAVIVSWGHGLDEKTVIKIQRVGTSGNFHISALDTLNMSMSNRTFCLVEVNTLFLLRLLTATDEVYGKEGMAAIDQLPMPSCMELKQERRDGDSEDEASSERNNSEKVGADKSETDKVEGNADETDDLGIDELEDDEAAAQCFFDAIREGSGGLQPFSSVIALVSRDKEGFKLATLTLEDREYLTKGLQEAHPVHRAFIILGMLEFPLL
ncbi:hypothetical protein F5883DRAFT_555082 [Diaporthe sp. PMI_573]|nr:hypothetical protein F5883DRAFT_555082 [Diaporthaceae sp. PMI_573]